jgi:hypothetical protein
MPHHSQRARSSVITLRAKKKLRTGEDYWLPSLRTAQKPSVRGVSLSLSNFPSRAFHIELPHPVDISTADSSDEPGRE